MPTETITTTCTLSGTTYTCSTPMSDIWNGNVSTFNTPFFSAGDMFISLLLIIGLILGIIAMLRGSIFKVAVSSKHEI